jgi:hypothetical protein
LSSRFADDFHFYELLWLVRFDYLTSDTISDFVNHRSEIFEHLNFGLWDVICSRLLLGARPANPNSRQKDHSSETYPLNGSRDLRGILCGLTSRFGGNLHDKGIVTVSASSRKSGSVSDILDLTQPTCFSTEKEHAPWISLDFHDRIVSPTGYTVILGRSMMKSVLLLSSFRLEVSMDGTRWTTIDRHPSLASSDSDPDLCHYQLVGSPAEGRYLRIMACMTDEISHAEAPLAIIAWEIFGTVRIRGPDDIAALAAADAARKASFESVLRATPFHMAAMQSFSGPTRALRDGICGDGRPLPDGLKGLANFLSDRNADDVLVTERSPPQAVSLSIGFENAGRRCCRGHVLLDLR